MPRHRLTAFLLSTAFYHLVLSQGYGNVPQASHTKRTTTTFAPDVIPSDQQAQILYNQYQNPQPTSVVSQPDNTYSNNPFLNPGTVDNTPQVPYKENSVVEPPGNLWWVKESPFKGATPVNPPVQCQGPQCGDKQTGSGCGQSGCQGNIPAPVGCAGNQCGQQQEVGGNCGYAGCQVVYESCSTPGRVCVPKQHCRGGVVDDVTQANAGVQKCDTATQVCCRLPTSGQVPNVRPNVPVRETRYPPYQGQGSAPGTNGIPIGGSIYDVQPTQGPFKPYTGPLNTTPYPGCAAALKCVEEIYCTAEGVMVEKPVSLTREQYENRVPLSECSNPDTGILGKCCRDPNYKDPWPQGMPMPGMPAGKSPVDQNGFPTGQYFDHQQKHGPSQPTPGVTYVEQPKPFIPERPYQQKPVQPPFRPQPTPQIIPKPVEPYRPPFQQPPQVVPKPVQPYKPQQQNIPRPQQPYQPQQENIPRPQQPYQPQQENIPRPQQPYQPQQENIPRPQQPYQPPQQNIPRPQQPYQPPQQNIPRPQQPYQPPKQNIPRPEAQQPPQQSYPTRIEQPYQPKGNVPAVAIVPGQKCGLKRPADRSGLRESEAGFGEYPWHVLIVKASTGQPLCSGALITDKAVVTAAHCVQDLDSRDLQIQTSVGRLNVQTNPRSPITTPCAALARHPGHDEGTLANDMAVLLLGTPVQLDEHVDTLCLPQGQPSTQGCVATGYGKQALQANAPGTTLHQININFIPNNVCEDKLKSTNLGKYFVLNQSFQCALPSNPGQDLCKVGPGGPIACDRGDGQHELSAIYSWDVGCGNPSNPTALASVDVAWIQNVLNSPLQDIVQVELNEIEKKKKSQEVVDQESKPGFSQGYGK